MIILGYGAKKFHLLRREDSKVLSNIIMNITLPCALVAGMNGSNIDSSILLLLVVGCLSNILLITVAKMRTRKKSELDQGMEMINTGGYNVGNFAIPFAAGFFPNDALPYLCMFDAGNSIMCLGGTFSIAKSVISKEKGIPIKQLLKNVTSSIAFDTYVILLLLSICHLTLPPFVVEITQMIGSANSFLAMLMLGILLEFQIDKSSLQSLIRILSTRYIGSIVIGLLLYTFLPLPLLTKEMTIIALLSPLSNMNAIFSENIGCNKEIPAMAATISILLSTLFMIIAILGFTT